MLQQSVHSIESNDKTKNRYMSQNFEHKCEIKVHNSMNECNIKFR